MTHELKFRSRLKRAVEQGTDPHWRSAMSSDELHRPRARPVEMPGLGRHAAVLMLFFPSAPSASEPNLVLTRRPDSLRNHPGQIAFPGGEREGEELLSQTATREAFEEVGVLADSVDVLGSLNSVYIPPSDFTVTPFIGWTETKPIFKLQEAEVAEAIEVPVSHLLDQTNRGLASVNSSRGSRDVPCFLFEHHKIWGATAMMLDDLLRRI